MVHKQINNGDGIMPLQYESIGYNEFDMEKAVNEYNEKLSVSALEIATKHNVPVSELHKEYAAFMAKRKVSTQALMD